MRPILIITTLETLEPPRSQKFLWEKPQNPKEFNSIYHDRISKYVYYKTLKVPERLTDSMWWNSTEKGVQISGQAHQQQDFSAPVSHVWCSFYALS